MGLIAMTNSLLIAGQCLGGGLVGITTEIGAGNCLATCKDTPGCLWFTFDTQGVCSMLDACSLDTDACPECQSGNFYNLVDIIQMFINVFPIYFNYRQIDLSNLWFDWSL